MKITIGLHKYNIPYNWNEVTIKDGIEMYSFCYKNIPKKLKQKYDIILKSNDLDNDIKEWQDTILESDIEDFSNFVTKVIHYFSKAPNNVLEYCSEESKQTIYTNYLERFVIDILFSGATYQPLGITKFKYKCKTYHLPKDKKIGDTIVPMYDLISMQFCECADLISLVNSGNDSFKYAPYVLAVLCLQDNEYYNEEMAIKRAKEFEGLNMDTLYEVFFCLINSIITHQKGLLSYSQSQKGLRELVRVATNGASYYWTSTLNQTIHYHLN